MSKIFLRAMYPYVTVGTPQTLSRVRQTSGAEHWRRFEWLLKSCLAELGHTIVEQRAHPTVPDSPADADVQVIAHRTKRDGPGDLFYKQMHLPTLFTIDTWGWGADHSKMQELPDFRTIDQIDGDDLVHSLQLRFIQSGISKQPQPARRQTKALPDKYIFVPTQMPGDYVQIYHAPISVLDYVVRTAQWAEARGQNIVIKLHPGFGSGVYPEVGEAVGRLAREYEYVACSNANVHDLIAESIGIFTINSGVGFEGLIHGKPVATFGNCDYKWVTFQGSVDCLDEARDFVLNYTDEQRGEAVRFLYFYCRRHAMSIASDDIAESRIRLMDYLAHATLDRDRARTISWDARRK